MPNQTPPRKRGRPPKDDEAMFDRINIRVPKPLMAKIDAMHRARRDGADKAQVIRELLARALGVA